MVSWETRCWSQDLGRDESCCSAHPGLVLLYPLSVLSGSGRRAVSYGGSVWVHWRPPVAQGLLIKLRFPLGTGSSVLRWGRIPFLCWITACRDKFAPYRGGAFEFKRMRDFQPPLQYCEWRAGTHLRENSRDWERHRVRSWQTNKKHREDAVGPGHHNSDNIKKCSFVSWPPYYRWKTVKKGTKGSWLSHYRWNTDKKGAKGSWPPYYRRYIKRNLWILATILQAEQCRVGS